MPSVLFLVQFNNFDWTTAFYWSYMFFIYPPILMRSCVMHVETDCNSWLWLVSLSDHSQNINFVDNSSITLIADYHSHDSVNVKKYYCTYQQLIVNTYSRENNFNKMTVLGDTSMRTQCVVIHSSFCLIGVSAASPTLVVKTENCLCNSCTMGF